MTESAVSSMGVCSQKSCHCFGAGLSVRLTILQASEPAAVACGHVQLVLEVHSMKCVCMYWLCLLACHCCQCCAFGGCGGPERRGQFWIFALAMYCLFLFLYVTQYLEYIRQNCGCPHFVSTHFAEMRHIFSFHHHVLGVIWQQYTYPECSTMTE